MTNALRGEASLTIDGKVYTLKYGWNAIAKIETVTGLGIREVAPMLGPENFRGGILIVVLWAMLQHNYPELTLQAVGELMDEADDPADISQAVGEAMERSSVGGKGNPQMASSSTGNPS